MSRKPINYQKVMNNVEECQSRYFKAMRNYRNAIGMLETLQPKNHEKHNPGNAPITTFSAPRKDKCHPRPKQQHGNKPNKLFVAPHTTYKMPLRVFIAIILAIFLAVFAMYHPPALAPTNILIVIVLLYSIN